MHPLEQHIQSTIDRLGLLRRSSPVLVALSGGADSVALLAVLVRLGYDCIAAHCNFHLRGAESVRDMRHAEQTARSMGVNIYIRDFNVPERMKATGESVEMACRSLRYEWFHSLLDRDYSQAIAVAHHREDNIETFFLNLLRSTGLAGLTGMDWRRDFVVRPMLDVSRADIEAYLADIGLSYVNDSSNASNDYRRNRLRNIILPMLEEHFPGASQAILNSMAHLRDAKTLLDSTVSEARHRAGATERRIDVEAVLGGYEPLQGNFVLFEILKPLGFNASQAADIARACRGGSTGLHFDIDAERFAEFDRGILTVHLRNRCESAPATTVTLGHDILKPIHIQVTPHDITEFKPVRDSNVIYLDNRILATSPKFELRHPRRGDRMQPYGMDSDKLVSDILKDAKLSTARKRSVWLLTCNGDILWIVGLRASALYTVTPATRRYLRLTYLP